MKKIKLVVALVWGASILAMIAGGIGFLASWKNPDPWTTPTIAIGFVVFVVSALILNHLGGGSGRDDFQT